MPLPPKPTLRMDAVLIQCDPAPVTVTVPLPLALFASRMFVPVVVSVLPFWIVSAPVAPTAIMRLPAEPVAAPLTPSTGAGDV